MESRSIVRGMSVAETAESGSLSKLRYFVLDAVVINGSAFRFIVHFRRDWFRGIGFVAVSRANTSTTIAPVFVANYGRCLFPEPSYIYIYIHTFSSAKTVSTVPTHFTYIAILSFFPSLALYRRCSKLLRPSRVIGRDVICIRVVARVFSTFRWYFSMLFSLSFFSKP